MVIKNVKTPSKHSVQVHLIARKEDVAKLKLPAGSKSRVAQNIVSKGFNETEVKKVSRLLSIAEYKRFQSAPGPKVTDKAFGRDRRFPLTSGFSNWN